MLILLLNIKTLTVKDLLSQSHDLSPPLLKQSMYALAMNARSARNAAVT